MSQCVKGFGALVIARIHLPAEVIHGVITTPQNPIVGTQPVIVELIASVPHTLATIPTDTRKLLICQRLGHEHVVIDRDYVVGNALKQGREDI